jgi:hypothetical protein
MRVARHMRRQAARAAVYGWIFAGVTSGAGSQECTSSGRGRRAE